MSLHHLVSVGTLVVMGMAFTPANASADWLFTPFAGVVYGGSADFGGGVDDEFERRFTYGATLGAMGAGVFGFELDFGYSPNFFETLADSDDDFTFADDSNVTTLMGNLVLGAPIGGTSGPGIRPYATAGLGLIRSQVTSAGNFFDIDRNSWGINVGAGLHLFFSDSVGLRGDLRYFRSLQGDDDDDDLDFDLADFKFWRGTVGLTFRFGG